MLFNFLLALFSLMATIAIAVATAAFRYAWTAHGDSREYKTKVDILFEIYTNEVKAAISIIHKPHPESKELDDLLDKLKILIDRFNTQTLSNEENLQLVKLLEKIRDDSNVSAGERMAAQKILNFVEIQYKMVVRI